MTASERKVEILLLICSREDLQSAGYRHCLKQVHGERAADVSRGLPGEAIMAVAEKKGLTVEGQWGSR